MCVRAHTRVCNYLCVCPLTRAPLSVVSTGARLQGDGLPAGLRGRAPRHGREPAHRAQLRHQDHHSMLRGDPSFVCVCVGLRSSIHLDPPHVCSHDSYSHRNLATRRNSVPKTADLKYVFTVVSTDPLLRALALLRPPTSIYT